MSHSCWPCRLVALLVGQLVALLRHRLYEGDHGVLVLRLLGQILLPDQLHLVHGNGKRALVSTDGSEEANGGPSRL